MNAVKKLTLVFIAISYITNVFSAAPAPKKPIALPVAAALAPAGISASYKANAALVTKEMAEKLKKERLCLTNFEDKKKEAKKEYRALVFEAATALGHPHPELIMLENNQEHEALSGVCLIKGQEGRGILINQDKIDERAYGARKMAIYHEVAHLAKNHCDNLNEHCKESRKILDDAEKLKKYVGFFHALQVRYEYEADHEASQAAACEECAQEEGNRYFELSVDRKGHTLSEIQSMEHHGLALRLEVLQPETITYCKTTGDCHPLNFERALRFHLYAKSEGIAGKLCAYHEQKADDDAKKENEKAEPIHGVSAATSIKKPTVVAASSPAHVKTKIQLFTQKQLSAQKYILKKLSLILNKTMSTTADLLLGKQIIPDETDNWSFKADNTFTPGEVVSIKKDGHRRYAVVLNQDDQGVIVQLEFTIKSKKLLTKVVGKKIG